MKKDKEYNNDHIDKDVIAALTVFAAGIISSMIFEFSLVIPMVLGYFCFAVTGMKRGKKAGEIVKISGKGAKDALIVVSVILLIGLVTGTWRSCGTIALFVNLGLSIVTPQLFILLAFLLCCVFSYAMGTSFGVVGTLGVILISLARAGDVNAALTAGAVLSGAYFGDRFSPVSSSMLLTAAVTGTKPEKNLPLMAKTMIIPVILSIAAYAAVSAVNPISSVDPGIAESIRGGFELSWIIAVPAVLMIILPLLKVKVKWAVMSSAVCAFALTIVCQHATFLEALRYAVFGYYAEGRMGKIFSGGGMISMAEVSFIILLSCSYSAIIEETGIFSSLETLFTKGCKSIGRVMMTFLSGICFSAVFCNQSVATIMCAIMLQKPYKETGGDEQELAIDIENTTIITTAWIPWSIFLAVPLSMLEAPARSMLYAFFIFLMPICHLATKRFIWPMIYSQR